MKESFPLFGGGREGARSLFFHAGFAQSLCTQRGMNASATHCLLGQGWWLLLRMTPKARSVLPWPSRLHRCCMTPLTPAMPPAIAATGFGFCRQLPLLVLCYSHLSEITETPICHLPGPPSGLLSPLCFHPSDHLLSCCCIFCSTPISRSLKYPRSP